MMEKYGVEKENLPVTKDQEEIIIKMKAEGKISIDNLPSNYKEAEEIILGIEK